MDQPDKSIVKFIKKHHVLTLATTFNNKPWCCNCFYAYNEKKQHFIFTSENNTRHIREITENPYVSGTIVLETKIIGKIKGVQFEGIVYKPDSEHVKFLKMNYLRRFPFIILSDTPIWGLEILHIKYTDNRLGFGKKLFWNKKY